MNQDEITKGLGASKAFNTVLSLFSGLWLFTQLPQTENWKNNPLPQGAAVLAFAYAARKGWQARARDGALLEAPNALTQTDFHNSRAATGWNASIYLAGRAATELATGQYIATGIYAAVACGGLIYTYQHQKKAKLEPHA